MSEIAETKLEELRSKTNRQLAALISSRLDRGLAFARLLDSDETRRDWASTEYFRVAAEHALHNAATWLPLLSDASPMERKKLDFKLDQLRQKLLRSTPLRAQAAG